MKTIQRFLVPAALLAVLLLAACSDLMNPPAAPAASGTGTVRVSVIGEGPAFSARTIYPDAPAADTFTYAYSFTTSPGGVPVADPARSGQTFTLPIGSYDLTVNAYLGSIAPGNLVTGGSTSAPFTVNNGEDTPVSITLKPVAAGPGTGTLIYTITYPAGTEVTSLTWGLVGEAAAALPAYTTSGAAVTKPQPVSAGYYVITALLTETATGKTAGKSEVVHIYQGLTTRVSGFSFAAGDFSITVSTAAGLTSVLDQPITAGAQAGTPSAPKTAAINVPYSTAAVAATDVIPAADAAALLFSNNDFATGAITGAATLALTSNAAVHLYVKVTAEDGATVLHYDVTITRTSPSANAGLTSVLGQSTTGASGTGTSGSPKTAAISVASGVATVAVANVVPAADAAALLYSDALFSTVVSPSLTLTPNVAVHLYVKVTAQDGVTVLHYDVAITRVASTDAGLTSVLDQSITAGAQAGTPSAPKTAAINVASGVAAVAVSQVVTAVGATPLLFSNNDFSTGAITGAATLALTVGSNSLYVKVTAEDGTTILHYDVTITRVTDAAAPTITGQSAGASYVQGNTAAALSVTANVGDSGTLSYEWFSNAADSNSGGTSIAATTTYTPPTATPGTVYYYVVVTNTNTAVDGIQTAAATSNAVAIKVWPSDPDLKIKFGVSTAGEAFTGLHNLISSPEPGDDFTAIIALGDYIDLDSLTIAGTAVITDRAITPTTTPFTGYDGRLLRLIVVGINSFDGINGNATPHVVFQFQNVPVLYKMETSSINYNGYLGSGMRTYLTGAFLTGLQTAAGLTDDMLWGPTRYVAHGGSGATQADTITDTLWLPTEWEMNGNNPYSSTTYETGANQARLEYYIGNARRIKHASSNAARTYWLASPYRNNTTEFCYVSTGGISNYNGASASQGCAPAFCVQ